MRFRLFARRYPVHRRRLVMRRFFPRPLRWLLLLVLLALCVFGALASRWGLGMMERFGRQEQSQAQIAQLQQDMLVLQQQLQAPRPNVAQDGEHSAGDFSGHIEQEGQLPAALLSQTRVDAGTSNQTTLEAVNVLELVHEATLQALRQQVKELQLENQHLKNELSFYENLLPAEDKSGLSIRGFTAERRGEDALSWQILLMQLKRDASVFKGELEWQVVGELDGKPWRLPAKERRQTIEIQSYQRLDGYLRIPAQLQLSSVTVVVWEGKNQRARQSIAFDADAEIDTQ